MKCKCGKKLKLVRVKDQCEVYKCTNKKCPKGFIYAWDEVDYDL